MGRSQKDIRDTEAMLNRLQQAGISRADAEALRRISMTLHRWHELECGDGNDYASWTIARGRYVKGADGTRTFEHDDNGAPYLERHVHTENKARYESIPDREAGARKRLAAILKRYPGLQAYVQGDPRGCALYILRSEDIREGASIDSCYTNGIAVFQ